jgi:hypothetical protein
LTIWSPESDGASESHLGQQKQPAVPAAYVVKNPRVKQLWRWYEMAKKMDALRRYERRAFSRFQRIIRAYNATPGTKPNV